MNPPPTRPQPVALRDGRQRGAALITAMLIAALAAVMVSGMFWGQWSAIAREQTAREQTQARWILRGSIDWARLILREDANTSTADYLGEPWSVPLAEARLSTFLAARGQDSAGLPDAWLEGRIEDAQRVEGQVRALHDAVAGATSGKCGIATSICDPSPISIA